MKSTDSYTKVYMNQFRSKNKGPWPHSQALFSGENLRIRLKDPNKITMQSSEKATDMIILVSAMHSASDWKSVKKKQQKNKNNKINVTSQFTFRLLSNINFAS